VQKEEEEGTSKRDLSMPLWKANLYLIALAPLIGFLLYGLYFLIWMREGSSGTYTTPNLAVGILVVAAGLGAHELIHGLSWAYFGRKPLSSVKYGVNLLIAYAHLREPMPARAYRIGVAMPGLLLGVLPYLVGLATGNGGVTLFGILFTLGACGDALILWLIRGVKPEKLVVEVSPTRLGCYVLE
jgi:hypothetical protein